MIPKVLITGQCGFDYRGLAHLIEACGGTPTAAHCAAETLAQLSSGSYALILVNRILAGDGSRGVDLIKKILTEQPAQPVMLVSDYPEAQAEAVACGALPGFGKSQLAAPSVAERVRGLLG